MSSDIIKIERADIKALESRTETIDNLNRKIQIVRKKQLLNTLKQTTDSRLDMLLKLRSWMDKLDKRLFSDESIATMPIDKVISLFKFVGQLSLKTIGQTTELEKILREYIEAPNTGETFNKVKSCSSDEEQKALKAEFVRSFMDSMKRSAAEAIISEQKQEARQVIEMRKVDEEVEINSLADAKVDLTDGIEELPEDLLSTK